MQHERPVAAEAGRDHLAALGMLADIARQREQRQRLLVVDAVDGPALGQAGALGLLAVAALDIGTEAAAAQRDLLARIGILAEHLRAVLGRRRSRHCHWRVAELARVAALRIVGAADEGAVFAEPQRQIAGAAFRADARIGAVVARREDQRRQFLVERVEHVGDAQFLDVVDGAEKSCQKSRSTSFQASLPSEISSSFSSSEAVKSYSTYFSKKLSRKADSSRPLACGISRRLSMVTYSRSSSVFRIAV